MARSATPTCMTFVERLFRCPLFVNNSDMTNQICHFEIGCRDRKKTAEFYSRMPLEKAQSLGGKKIVGPVALPGAGSFGWFADPEGNTIGVYAESGK